MSILTVVNTSETADYSGRLRLRTEDAGSVWHDQLTHRSFVATDTSLPITIPRGGTSASTNLLVLVPLLSRVRRSRGSAVGALQSKLNALGFNLKVDRDFGALTEAAVLKFQRDHGLNPDGKVGALTWGALQAATG